MYKPQRKMKPKKIKLQLNKEFVSNLTENQLSKIIGGHFPIPATVDCTAACTKTQTIPHSRHYLCSVTGPCSVYMCNDAYSPEGIGFELLKEDYNDDFSQAGICEDNTPVVS